MIIGGYGYTDGQVVNSTGRFSRGHNGSQLSVISVSGTPMSLLALTSIRHSHGIHIHAAKCSYA